MQQFDVYYLNIVFHYNWVFLHKHAPFATYQRHRESEIDDWILERVAARDHPLNGLGDAHSRPFFVRGWVLVVLERPL